MIFLVSELEIKYHRLTSFNLYNIYFTYESCVYRGICDVP